MVEPNKKAEVAGDIDMDVDAYPNATDPDDNEAAAADDDFFAGATNILGSKSGSKSKISSAASAGGAASPRFKIKKWNAVAMWSWDCCAKHCAICRNSINKPSIEYQANPSPTNKKGLSITFGNCGHVCWRTFTFKSETR